MPAPGRILALARDAAHRFSKVGAPQETSQILIGTLLMSAVIAYEITRRRAQAATIREAAARAVARPTSTPAGAAA